MHNTNLYHVVHPLQQNRQKTILFMIIIWVVEDNNDY